MKKSNLITFTSKYGLTNGFTLIEVLIATAIMVIMIMTASAAEAFYIRSGSSAIHSSQANALVQEGINLSKYVRDKNLMTYPNSDPLTAKFPIDSNVYCFDNSSDPSGFIQCTDPGIGFPSEKITIDGVDYYREIHIADANPTVIKPIAPSNLTITTNSTTQIDADWQDHSTDETGFNVYTSSTVPSTNCSDLGNNYSLYITTAANATSQIISGLQVNTRYCVKVTAANGANESDPAYPEVGPYPLGPIYTLANTPLAPTVNPTTFTSLTIIINQNSNPLNTTYAIHETTKNKFVQADGSLGDTAVYQTYAVWGGGSGIENKGLTTGTTYTYEVKAVNGDSIETSYGPASSGTPSIPWNRSVIGAKPMVQVIYSIIWDSVHSKYVAAGTDSGSGNTDGYVWESTDLITWTPHLVIAGSSPTSGLIINTIIYNPVHSKYIAAGYNGAKGTWDAYVWESTDLITWTPRAVATGKGNQQIFTIIYDSVHSKYVAAGTGDPVSGGNFDAYVWESTNLTSWTSHTIASGTSSQSVISIIYDSTNSKYVVTGIDDILGVQADIYVWESTNLTSWTPHFVFGGASVQYPYAFIYVNGKYIIGGYSNNGSGNYDAYVWESTNLTSWTPHVVDGSINVQQIFSIIWDSVNNKYVAAGLNYASGSYDVNEYDSTDLITWTPSVVANGPGHQRVYSLIYANNKYIMAGSDDSSGTIDAMVWYRTAP